jgi:hypothetical protein
MRKRWCHDHKSRTSDNWERARDMVRWVVLHAVPYIRLSLRLENTQGSLQSEIPGSNSETWEGGSSVMVWTGVSWYSILLVLLLPFMAELLQGSTWTDWLIRCIPWSRRFFRTTMQFSKTTAGTVQSWFREHEGNFNIFPGQHSHQIWTLLNHSGLFWRLVWGTDSHLQHL